MGDADERHGRRRAVLTGRSGLDGSLSRDSHRHQACAPHAQSVCSARRPRNVDGAARVSGQPGEASASLCGSGPSYWLQLSQRVSLRLCELSLQRRAVRLRHGAHNVVQLRHSAGCQLAEEREAIVVHLERTSAYQVLVHCARQSKRGSKYHSVTTHRCCR